MIAPDFAIPQRLFAREAKSNVLISHLEGRAMNFPWFQLFLNFALLGVALFAARLLNADRRAPPVNGALFFLAFCILAMLLDIALTFVFASASTEQRMRYIDLSSSSDCGKRALAYAIPAALAAFLAARFRLRHRRSAPTTLTITTSQYTRSEMPL